MYRCESRRGATARRPRPAGAHCPSHRPPCRPVRRAPSSPTMTQVCPFGDWYATRTLYSATSLPCAIWSMRSASMRMPGLPAIVIIGEHGVLEVVPRHVAALVSHRCLRGRRAGELTIQVLMISATTASTVKTLNSISAARRGRAGGRRTVRAPRRARPPLALAIQCAADQHQRVRIRDGARDADRRHQRQDRECRRTCRRSAAGRCPSAAVKRRERGHLVAARLDHMRARRVRACAAAAAAERRAAERRHRDARGHQELDAVAVAYMEHLERLAARARNTDGRR